jgi:small subunit ribosomal protein S4
MGDIKKQKKKYATPMHPWEKERIEAEKIIVFEYGLKNKREIWRANTMLSKFKSQAKKCSAASTPQLELEKRQLLQRLQSLGLIKETGGVDEVLGLNVKDILERRLQTVVFRKSLGKTVNMARQCIVHGHITIRGKKLTVPGYLIKKDEEDKISFKASSSFAQNNG